MTWEKFVKISREEWIVHAAHLSFRHAELQRVRDHFGDLGAVNYARAEFEIPSGAFLVEFDLLDEAEKLGLVSF